MGIVGNKLTDVVDSSRFVSDLDRCNFSWFSAGRVSKGGGECMGQMEGA